MPRIPVFFELDSPTLSNPISIVSGIRTLLLKQRISPLPFASKPSEFLSLLEGMKTGGQKPSLFVMNMYGAEIYIKEFEGVMGEAPVLLLNREMAWLKSGVASRESQRVQALTENLKGRRQALWYYGKANWKEVSELAVERIKVFLAGGDFNGLEGTVRASMDPIAINEIEWAKQKRKREASQSQAELKVLKETAEIELPPAIPDLAGQLREQNVPQLLQFMQQNQKTGELRIKSGDQNGLFVFKEGKAVFAESGALQGEEAIYACARSTDGTFWFISKDTLPERPCNIQQSAMNIAFECCRLLDEQKKPNSKKMNASA